MSDNGKGYGYRFGSGYIETRVRDVDPDEAIRLDIDDIHATAVLAVRRGPNWRKS